MDLSIEKLEKFGLENFIKVYRFYLCSRTVSPNQVAAFLGFDEGQTAIINQPPDNFSKCERLYELVQKKSGVKDFLEALDETGNEHILKFIKEANFSTPLNRRRGIWFNIPEPIESFCGREDFLTKLHDLLKPQDDSETEVTVLSQVKIVTGLGGIGKTQTARKYMMQHKKLYNNLIWINAETENSIKNSFFKLAEELQIPVKNSEKNPREIQEIVKEIYNKICDGGKSNLIVFDNAEDYLSCKNFFPFGLHVDFTKPVILVTSRNQEWISPTGKIQVLPLDKMTEDESLEFISKQLEIPESEIPEFREESKEFIELIGGLPLALQQAVAFIKHQKKETELLARPYKMNDYVQEFKSSAEKLQKFPHVPDSSTTVFITWDLTLKKIKKNPVGKTAIEVIAAISFLYADKIPVEFLLPPPPQNCINRLWKSCRQQDEDFQSSDLVEGLNYLQKFSMIKITGNFVSIHRQVQFVILQNLKGSGRLLNLFHHFLGKYNTILKSIKVSECSDAILNIHQIVNNQFDFILMNKHFLDFMFKFGRVLFRASRYSESLELYKIVHSKYLELLGQNHQIALQLHQLGRYEEALTLYKEILEKEEFHLGPDHPSTILTKHNMAAVLRLQKKYADSLELSQQVLAQRKKIYGENHSLTLATLNQIALLHAELGNFSEALALFERVETKRIKILGPDHQDVLWTKHNKATVLFKMGKFQEASKIFSEVYEKEKKLLGENHLLTINTLFWIARTLEQEGKFREALKLYRKVYEIRRSNLGEAVPVLGTR